MADMLTIPQAAERTGVSAKTIRRGATSGKYPGAVREAGASGRWLIPARDVDQAHRVVVVTVEPDYYDDEIDPADLLGDDDMPDAPNPAGVPGPSAGNGARSGAHLATLPADPTVVGPILLSVQAVAGVLGITEYAVRQAIKREQLAGYPWGPGGAMLVPVAELRRLAGA